MTVRKPLDNRRRVGVSEERGTEPTSESPAIPPPEGPSKRAAGTGVSPVERLGKLEQRLNMLTMRVTECSARIEEIWMAIGEQESEPDEDA